MRFSNFLSVSCHGLFFAAACFFFTACPGGRPGNPREAETRLLTPQLVFGKMGDRFETKPIFTNPDGLKILSRGYPPPKLQNPAEGNKELEIKFQQSLSNPKLWRELDREYRFGSVFLGGSPASYRPLLQYLYHAPDWALFHVDHQGVVFVRQPAQAWTMADLDAIREKFRQDRKNDQVAFLASCSNVLIELEKYEDAERYLADAFTLNDKRYDAWTAKAVLAAKRQQWPQADEAATQALSLEPQFTSAQYVKAQALFALKRYNDAYAAAQKLVQREPENASYLLLYAKAAHEAGDGPEEIKTLEKLIDLVTKASGSASAYRVYLGQAYSSNRMPKEAREQFEMAVAAGDLNADQLSFATMAIKRFQEAEQPAQQPR